MVLRARGKKTVCNAELRCISPDYVEYLKYEYLSDYETKKKNFQVINQEL
jgi:hypothetical protein